MQAPRALTAFLLTLGLLLAGLAGAQALQAVPPLRAHVTDNAGMLDAGQRAALEGVLSDYEAKTGSQIAVLLVNSTEPEAIEQYSIRVTDVWKLGRKGVDDGVLLLVAKDNPPALRRLRIEAGRGVQGVLTDAQSKRVLQDVIAPHFRQNDYYGGLVAGVGALATLLNQEKFPAAAQAPAGSGTAAFWGPLLLFAVLTLAAILRSRGGPRLNRSGWSRDASGVLLGAALGSALGHRGGGGGGFGGGGGGGGFGGGGGGGFDGGGASGNW